MSIRRLVQIVAFLAAFALAFASPVANNAAYACDPMGSSGFC